MVNVVIELCDSCFVVIAISMMMIVKTDTKLWRTKQMLEIAPETNIVLYCRPSLNASTCSTFSPTVNQ